MKSLRWVLVCITQETEIMAELTVAWLTAGTRRIGGIWYEHLDCVVRIINRVHIRRFSGETIILFQE